MKVTPAQKSSLSTSLMPDGSLARVRSVCARRRNASDSVPCRRAPPPSGMVGASEKSALCWRARGGG